jgi:hypothetical protein
LAHLPEPGRQRQRHPLQLYCRKLDLAQAHERNRSDVSRSAGRYLKRIFYGNAPSRLKQPDLAQLTWLFEVLFDYDEGHYQALPQDAQGREYVHATTVPSQPWSVRQDPLSSHRSCFEMRTYRLCRRVLMFHHFPDELGTPDYLVRTTEFSYRETPIASFITNVTQSGYRRGPNGSYLKRSLPSLDFDYSEAIVQQEVNEVDPESLANLPASVDGSRYQWLDLDGEGLQCVLAEEDDGWYYKRNISPSSQNVGGGPPLSSARFEPLTEIASLPSFAQTGTPRHQFLDLAGDASTGLSGAGAPTCRILRAHRASAVEAIYAAAVPSQRRVERSKSQIYRSRRRRPR